MHSSLDDREFATLDDLDDLPDYEGKVLENCWVKKVTSYGNGLFFFYDYFGERVTLTSTWFPATLLMVNMSVLGRKFQYSRLISCNFHTLMKRVRWTLYTINAAFWVGITAILIHYDPLG